MGSSTLFDPLISRLGSSIQIRRLPQNTTPLLFSYSPWTCYEQTGKYFKQRQVVLILNSATEYHPPSSSNIHPGPAMKIFQTKISCYDSEFCQRLPSSLLFSYSPCLEQTTKDFKQKHIFLPQNTNPLILIFLPCLSVNPKEKEIKQAQFSLP